MFVEVSECVDRTVESVIGAMKTLTQNDRSGEDNKNMLDSLQKERDEILINLKKEKQQLLAACTPEGEPIDAGVPHFNHILPLVEDVHWLELKEKSIKKEYEHKLLQTKARHLGQEILRDSISPDECVLKKWFEELTDLKNHQPELLKLSADKMRTSSVHNIEYHTHLNQGVLKENLSFTVLCKTVNVRVRVESSISCPSKHLLAFTSTEMKISSDIHVPSLEDSVVQCVKSDSSVSNVIAFVASHILEDIAPYVIGLPLKKIKKKKITPSSSTAATDSTLTEALDQVPKDEKISCLF